MGPRYVSITFVFKLHRAPLIQTTIHVSESIEGVKDSPVMESFMSKDVEDLQETIFKGNVQK